MIARCRCGATWTGARLCHCGTCHETFTSIGAFDKHRRGSADHRECDIDATTESGRKLLQRNFRGHYTQTDSQGREKVFSSIGNQHRERE